MNIKQGGMIYFKADTGEQTVFFPKGGRTDSGAFEIELTGTDNLKRFTFEALVTASGQRYVEASVTLPDDILPGEYVYKTKTDGHTDGIGLAWVGSLSSDVSEFDAEIYYTYE